MQRVIDEMAKAKGDVEKRYREKIPEIIRECMAFAYLGKSFTFDANAELEDKVNMKLITLSDEIMEDIEARAKRCIAYAEDEEDEDTILAYMKREQNGEDLLSRIDKHNSNFRYFLEGWMAIGMVNGLSESALMSNIMTYMHNVYVSKLWQDAFKEGYLSNSIRTRGYSFGKGIMRSPIEALSLLEQDSINSAFQYGRFKRFQKNGAIGYTIHRNSGFDCPYCDSYTGIIHPMTESLLPLHPRCVCYSKPFMEGDEFDGFIINNISLYRRNLKEYNRLRKDANYIDVSQSKVNAAVGATHKGHNLIPDEKQKFFNGQFTSVQLEKECQNECLRMGHSLILADENVIGKNGPLTSLDTYADWIRADIRSITQNGENTIINGIQRKSRQIEKFNALFPDEATNSLILYFHEPSMFDRGNVIQSWYAAGYNRQRKPIKNNVRRIICVVRGYEDWIVLDFK